MSTAADALDDVDRFAVRVADRAAAQSRSALAELYSAPSAAAAIAMGLEVW